MRELTRREAIGGALAAALFMLLPRSAVRALAEPNRFDDLVRETMAADFSELAAGDWIKVTVSAEGTWYARVTGIVSASTIEIERLSGAGRVHLPLNFAAAQHRTPARPARSAEPSRERLSRASGARACG